MHFYILDREQNQKYSRQLLKNLYKRNIYFYNVIASPERARQSTVASAAWQSHPIKTRSPRRFAPRDDTGIIAFVLVLI